MRKRHGDAAIRQARHQKKDRERLARRDGRVMVEEERSLPNKFVIEPGSALLASCGPQFFCNWGVPASVADALVAGGRDVPLPIMGAILLDTGATRTCIALEAATQLGLQATRMQDGLGAAGAYRNPVFLARLEIIIEHPKTRKQKTYSWEQEVEGIPDLHKFAAPLTHNGQAVLVSGLLGRDILRHARVFYDGPVGRLRFEFDVASLQNKPSR